MSTLEEPALGTSVRRIVPDCLVTIVNVEWYGSNAVELTHRDATGRVSSLLLYRDDEPRIEVVQVGRPWSFDGDGNLFKLVSETQRIRRAHPLDPPAVPGSLSPPNCIVYILVPATFEKVRL
jgi:hypothetical protein